MTPPPRSHMTPLSAMCEIYWTSLSRYRVPYRYSQSALIGTSPFSARVQVQCSANYVYMLYPSLLIFNVDTFPSNDGTLYMYTVHYSRSLYRRKLLLKKHSQTVHWMNTNPRPLRPHLGQKLQTHQPRPGLHRRHPSRVLGACP